MRIKGYKNYKILKKREAVSHC